MDSINTSRLTFSCLHIVAIFLALHAGICKSSDGSVVAMDLIERANRNSGEFLGFNQLLSLLLHIVET